MPSAGIFASARVAAASISATFQTSAVDASDQTTSYTFASQPIGTASATRRVVVSVITNSARTITGVTIGGVSASLDVTHTVSGTAHLVIASAVVPTGTTASVVVSLDGGAAALGCGIGVWTLTGGSPTGQTATGSGDPTGLTVTTSTGDVVIGYAFTTGYASAIFNWTGLTERFDEDVYSSTTSHSGGDTVATGSSTALSVDTSGATSAGVAAAYA